MCTGRLVDSRPNKNNAKSNVQTDAWIARRVKRAALSDRPVSGPNPARTVAQCDGMMIAVVEQLARPLKRFVFGAKIFGSVHAFVAA
jgi:hypothetical protein